MTQVKDTTECTPGKKGSHLSCQEMCFIEVLLMEGYTNREIAKRLNRAPQTINNAVNKGKTKQIRRQEVNGKIYQYSKEVYFADVNFRVYKENRSRCGRRPKWLKATKFLAWADKRMKAHGWSPDACVGRAKKLALFPKEEIPCTTSLYNWIDAGHLDTKNIDLPEKVRRKPRSNSKDRTNKKVLGESIENRPPEVDNRSDFGHWEVDSVLGTKGASEPALLTLVERKTRYEWPVLLPNQSAEAVDEVFKEMFKGMSPLKEGVIKTLTFDNGSEFSGVSGLIEGLKTYFCHPYSAWERGTSENQHKLIRRFLKKGVSLRNVSQEQVNRIRNWMNHYPRAILNYQTAHECFMKELQEILKKLAETESLLSG